MTAITEDYCNFETAKLLKEKGFNESCYACYLNKELSHYDYASTNFELIEDVISAPTLQMAMKWLREAHKLYINIWADPKDVESNNFDIIFRAQIYNGTSNYGTYEFSTYEEASEASVRYCLENLI